MNDKNLEGHGFDKMTTERQREIASQGGKASQKKKKERAEIKAVVQDILNEEYKDKKGNSLSGVAVLVTNLFKIAVDPKNKQCLSAMQMLFNIYNDKDSRKLIDKKTKAEIKLLETKISLLTNADTTTIDKLDEILKEMKKSAEE